VVISPHQANFLAPLLGTEEGEAPTSTTFSHINYMPALGKQITVGQLIE
jgi:hypothetical protein